MLSVKQPHAIIRNKKWDNGNLVGIVDGVSITGIYYKAGDWADFL